VKPSFTDGTLALVGALELARLALQLLNVTLHCSGSFALADSSRLFIKLSTTYFAEYTGFFAGTLEASQCDIEGFVLLDSYVRHGSTCFQ
jgi:hypothetical protein